MLTPQSITLRAVQGQAFDQTFPYNVDNGSVPWVPSATHATNDVLTNAPVASPSWNGLYYRVTAGGGGASGSSARASTSGRRFPGRTPSLSSPAFCSSR